jgi:hypothetical protein
MARIHNAFPSRRRFFIFSSTISRMLSLPQRAVGQRFVNQLCRFEPFLFFRLLTGLNVIKQLANHNGRYPSQIEAV